MPQGWMEGMFMVVITEQNPVGLEFRPTDPMDATVLRGKLLWGEVVVHIKGQSL